MICLLYDNMGEKVTYMKKTACALLCLVLLLTACDRRSDPATEMERMEEFDVEELVMTEEEILLLGAVYGNEAQLREGKLYDYQKVALEYLRKGLAYLDEKYPGYAPEILTFSPATKFTPWAQFLIRGEGELTYTLTVEKKDEGFVCLDNCYGRWIREAYDAHVMTVLRDSGFMLCAYTSFTDLMGMDIGAGTTVTEFVEYTPKINRQTRLYLRATDNPEEDAQKIRQILKEAGLYGHYFLYTVPAEQYGEVSQMEQLRKSWDSIAFNCYDA